MWLYNNHPTWKIFLSTSLCWPASLVWEVSKYISTNVKNKFYIALTCPSTISQSYFIVLWSCWLTTNLMQYYSNKVATTCTMYALITLCNLRCLPSRHQNMLKEIHYGQKSCLWFHFFCVQPIIVDSLYDHLYSLSNKNSLVAWKASYNYKLVLALRWFHLLHN